MCTPPLFPGCTNSGCKRGRNAANGRRLAPVFRSAEEASHAPGATDLPQLAYKPPQSGFVRSRSMSSGFTTFRVSPQVYVRRLAVAALCLMLAGPLLGAGRAAAEPAGVDPSVRVPGFWDPRRRPE